MGVPATIRMGSTGLGLIWQEVALVEFGIGLEPVGHNDHLTHFFTPADRVRAWDSDCVTNSTLKRLAPVLRDV